MIGRIVGALVLKQPPQVLVDVGGVGYELEVSVTTLAALPEVGAQVSLHTHLAVREDAHTLYGFASAAERALFRSLIRVSGIGAKLALLILSGMSPEEFARAVHDGNTAALSRLPGIGKKTAERLIVEMRDRIDGIELGRPVRALAGGGAALAAAVDPVQDALSALVALGYKAAEAERMVRAIDCDGLGSDVIIRRALQAAVRG